VDLAARRAGEHRALTDPPHRCDYSAVDAEAGRGSGSFNFARPGRWVLLLLILLVVLNVGGLLVYRASHPREDLSLQLWNYLESGTFKLVAGSLVLPLLVFLVEGRFNVAETIRKSREERAQKAQDDRQQWRLETVQQTAQTWNDLYGLATEVVYWEPEKDLRDLLARITNFYSRAGETVNSWPIQFPSVNKALDVGAVLILLNTLGYCTHSVAVYLGAVEDAEERAELQATLGVIQDGIKIGCHNAIMRMLKCGLELEALRDARRFGGTTDGDAEAEEGLLHEIEELANGMGEWVKAIQEREARAEPMPVLADSVAGDFREAYHSARGWLRENPGRRLSEYPGVDTFRARFAEIPHPALMRAYDVAYSKEWLRELADWFALTSYSSELEERLQPPT
jgi:hypothetical protein